MTVTRITPSGRTVKSVQHATLFEGTSAASYLDVTLDITSYGFSESPIVIPLNGQWAWTEIRSISKTAIVARVWSVSGAHSTKQQITLVELV